MCSFIVIQTYEMRQAEVEMDDNSTETIETYVPELLNDIVVSAFIINMAASINSST